MSITQDGIEGEKIARRIFAGNQIIPGIGCVFGGDWIAQEKHDGDYFIIECKHKELFNPPPFLGTGLNISQVISRTKFYQRTNIRTIVFICDKITKISYWQYLDKLEKGKYFDTEKKIRIYPIENYETFNNPLTKKEICDIISK